MRKPDQVAELISVLLGRYPTPEEVERCMVIEREHEKVTKEFDQQMKATVFTGYSGKVVVKMDYRYWVQSVEVVGFYLWNRKKLERDIAEAMNAASLETSEGVKIFQTLAETEETKHALRYYEVLGISHPGNEEEITPVVDKKLN
jgi:hypothetical protein